MILLIPILILALGGVALPLLATVPRVRNLPAIGAGFAGMALLVLGWLGTLLPLQWVASSWRPLALFGAPLSLGGVTTSWILMMVLVGTSFLSLVACSIGPKRPDGSELALILGTTAAGVVALLSTSFVTLIAAWSTTDLLLTAIVLRLGRRGMRRAGLTLMSGVLASASLWAGLLLAQPEGISGFRDLAQFTGASASLLQLAVILRLGLVPLHLWRPIDVEATTAEIVPLVVIPTLLGFDLLTYLPALTAGLPSVLFALAAVTVLVGGFVAWSESEERASLAGVMVGETGLAVLAVANAGQQAVATAIAAAVAWALGITVFALSPGWSGRRFWLSIPSLLGLLSLLGVPPSLGFLARFTAYSGLEAALPALVVALLGETFLVAALVRSWLWAEPRPLSERPQLRAIYLAVFALGGMASFVAGAFPESITGRAQDTALLQLGTLLRQGGVPGWTGWALPLVAGVTLFLAGEGLRQNLESGWRGLGALLRLEWVYGLAFVFMRWVVAFVRGAGAMIEGEGALLWTAVVLLLILLYLTRGAGPGG
jgi:formate hydrogenlyase subunit 3/multisubunit Na+/H+ antiporter MnhD subunit